MWRQRFPCWRWRASCCAATAARRSCRWVLGCQSCVECQGANALVAHGGGKPGWVHSGLAGHHGAALNGVVILCHAPTTAATLFNLLPQADVTAELAALQPALAAQLVALPLERFQERERGVQVGSVSLAAV